MLLIYIYLKNSIGWINCGIFLLLIIGRYIDWKYICKRVYRFFIM